MNTPDQQIPHFEDKKDPQIPGKPLVERNTIQAIVINRRTNEVLCLNWPEFDWKTFIIGGIEDGEDLITAAKREIAEETVYTDVTFIAEICKTKSSFYAAHKGVNRIANATNLLFELASDEHHEPSMEETKNHSYQWVPVERVKDFINIEAQLYAWEKALVIL